jgi:exodeoxyribonuclease V alpha subunit
MHRLLEIDPAYGGFKRNEEYYPLLCDYLVIDETSRVDVPLFYIFAKNQTLPINSVLFLVGDVDQLLLVR